jgi:hypothetical protein
MANIYENRKDIKTSIHIHTERDALWWCYTYIIDTKYETSIHSSYQREKEPLLIEHLSNT